MNSIFLSTVSRLLTGVLLVFSVFLLLRGHNLPGGGFSGGLVAASAVVLHALAQGFPSARQMLGINPRVLAAIGLLVAIASGLAGMLAGRPFLTGLWSKTLELPVVGKIGTPLVFDVGVYLTVLGVTTLIVFSLGEEGEEG
jgi:multicomponent Na+:H+ antiporter subunit B